MKTLLVVDPQNDFITGSLAVSGASEAIKNLVENIKTNNYDRLIVTLDWHPFDHYSFVSSGGVWPPHCIQHTWGSAICPELSDVLIEQYDNFDMMSFVTKGSLYSQEEYGAFDLELPNLSGMGIWKLNRVTKDKNNPIYVAGIAGDFCVYHTVKNLIKLGFTNIILLKDCIASIDGGSKLGELIKVENLLCV